jgi:hypothetical protein
LAQVESRLSKVESRDILQEGNRSPSFHNLEDEIHILRCKMELTYMEESTFNAERVIEISRKLDIVINEYMRHRFGCSNG